MHFINSLVLAREASKDDPSDHVAAEVDETEGEQAGSELRFLINLGQRVALAPAPALIGAGSGDVASGA